MIPNLSMLHNHIDYMLETCAADVFWKDKNNFYLGINYKFLEVCNMSSVDEVVGKTDRDLLWSEQADVMIHNDQEIIATANTNSYLEPALSANNEIVTYLAYKTPLRARSGKIIGTFGLSYPLTDADSFVSAFNETAQHMYQQIKPKTNDKDNQLSKQQLKCLLYLTKGMTIKQIAITMKLSAKTVEHYLNTVKQKLKVYSRVELVAKALQIPAIQNQLLGEQSNPVNPI